MVKLKMMNRVNKEVKLLEDYYGKDNIQLCRGFEDELQEYVINIYKNKHLFSNVKIILYHDYPFKEPALCLYHFDKINNIIHKIKYFDFFTNAGTFYFTNISLDGYLCPCCYNALCNRQLSNTLLYLSKDIQKFYFQFNRLREKYFLKKYIQSINYLNNDILNIILIYI